MIIYKYGLLPEGKTSLSLAKGWEILTIQVQDGSVMLWAKVPTEGELETVDIIVRPTGASFTEKVAWSETYLGTFQLLSGRYVGHVFLIDDEALEASL